MERGKPLAEALGTLTLLLVGTSAAAAAKDGVAVALAHGLAITLMVVALGHVSGGHFNPAVSFAFFLRGGRNGGLLGGPAPREACGGGARLSP
ncbi:aquaporin [Thermus sp.]|uniref:aquaporin n=1 Tax=Thermus sp. TaxID=275 RepID=UPI00321FAA52